MRRLPNSPLTVRKLSQEQIKRIFENLFEGLQKLCAGRTIDYAMIARESDAHSLADYHLIVPDDRFGTHGADCHDGAFRGIDYGREFIDAEHSQITNRESCAGVFFGLEFSRSRSPSQFSNLAGDIDQGLEFSRADDWRYQSVI